MKGLHVINCIDAGKAAFKYVVGHRSIKVKEIITLEAMILRLLRVTLTPAQANLHIVCCVVIMAGSGLKSAKKEKGCI
jgi:hypothetical protein